VRSQEARDHRAAKYQGGTCGMGLAAQWPMIIHGVFVVGHDPEMAGFSIR